MSNNKSISESFSQSVCHPASQFTNESVTWTARMPSPFQAFAAAKNMNHVKGVGINRLKLHETGQTEFPERFAPQSATILC